MSILLKSSLYILFALFAFQPSVAQKRAKKERPKYAEVPSSDLVYDDVNYIPEIKTVAFYNAKREGSFPIINLTGGEELLLGFDDLRGGSRNLSYSVVHCNSDWTPSSISSIEYLESFSEDRITDYRFSYNTYQKYTHYQLRLPNFAVRPKLSGNYLLKVFEDGDPNKLLISRRFYILQQKVGLHAEVAPSPSVAHRDSNQKINFTVAHPALNIQNAYQEIKAVVLQNARQASAKTTNRPLFIRNAQLVYSDNSSNDFAGGNEFHRFDTRSFRYKSDGVYAIQLDSIYQVALFADEDRNRQTYAHQFDENGSFFTINQDGSDARYDGDYANISFVLKAEKPNDEGFAYVVGKFNGYQKNAANRMVYDENSKTFILNSLVKQGVVDYRYVWAGEKGNILDTSAFEGSYYQTENDYQILIYYRAPGARYDQLIAFTQLNSVKAPRNF